MSMTSQTGEGFNGIRFWGRRQEIGARLRPERGGIGLSEPAKPPSLESRLGAALALWG